MRAFVVFLLVLLAVGIALAQTPPPPYTDPQLTTTNALGGIGRTQGYKVTTNTTAALDLLAAAQIPTALVDDLTAADVSTKTRFVSVELACTAELVDGGPNTDCTLDAGEAACVRLGPATNVPPLSCTGAGILGGATGGCYLKSVGDVCQFTLRPITQCTSYAECHGPLWAMTSSGGTPLTLVVSVAW
jgi:hypothetical protein